MLNIISFTAQKMKFSIMDIFDKCDQIRRFLRIWSHLLKKLLMEKFILCAVLLNMVTLKTFEQHYHQGFNGTPS